MRTKSAASRRNQSPVRRTALAAGRASQKPSWTADRKQGQTRTEHNRDSRVQRSPGSAGSTCSSTSMGWADGGERRVQPKFDRPADARARARGLRRRTAPARFDTLANQPFVWRQVRGQRSEVSGGQRSYRVSFPEGQVPIGCHEGMRAMAADGCERTAPDDVRRTRGGGDGGGRAGSARSAGSAAAPTGVPQLAPGRERPAESV